MTAKHETKISKGYQTVVPAHIRKAHEISPGDRLVWREEGGDVTIEVRKRKTLQDIEAMISIGGDAVKAKREAQRGET